MIKSVILRSPRRPGRLLRPARQRLRRLLRTGDERVVLALLVGLTVLVGVLGLVVDPAYVPPVAVVLPLLAGGMLLRRRPVQALAALVLLVLLLDLARLGVAAVRPGALAVVVAVAFLALQLSGSRERLGLGGLRGEAMLTELRERLEAQGEMPKLPPGWEAEVALRPAGGGAFAGDFLVSSVTANGSRLELALVDVSGKGVDAGTRALLLSGALGSLLGAVAPEEFLPAANTYLCRLDWDEGFATAAHVMIDLRSGEYLVESAGHPPVAQFDAGSGRWDLSRAEGTALGLLPGAGYVPQRGMLRAGDALLLYTDGIVEVAGRDLAVGIDKLLGEAERLVPSGFRGGTAKLIDAVAPYPSDDRAVLLLWRS